ncbi:MAG: hypothetical protein U5K38_11940 [Woeseiaceae bacterium]|nr:hypothetical protein [Woeseiaceae bacterium]
MVGFKVSNGGYIDNVYTGEEDYNDEEIFGGRLIGLWRATDILTAKATVMYQDADADGRPQEQRRNDPRELVTGSGFDLALANESTDQLIITDERQNVKFVDNEFDDEFVLTSLQFDVEFDQFSLTSITSYLDREMNNTLDDTRRTRDLLGLANLFGAAEEAVFALGDFDPATLEGAIFLDQVDLENKTTNEKLTQELRISSRFGGPLNFVAGLYLEDDSRQLDQINDLDGLDDWIASPNNLDGFFGSNFGSPLENAYFDGTFDVDTTQVAAFAEFSYEFGDFELLAGGRLFDYEQDVLIRWQGWVEFSDDLLDETTSKSGFNPKLELLYRPTDESIYYAARPPRLPCGQRAAIHQSNILRVGACQPGDRRRADDDRWRFSVELRDRYEADAVRWLDDRQHQRLSNGLGRRADADIFKLRLDCRIFAPRYRQPGRRT